MNDDVAAVNEQIAQIKGWTQHEDGGNYWLRPEGKDWVPLSHWTAPAMWAALLVEIASVKDITVGPTDGPSTERVCIVSQCDELFFGDDPDPMRACGLAVCRAYVAAHLPAEAPAKGEGR